MVRFVLLTLGIIASAYFCVYDLKRGLLAHRWRLRILWLVMGMTMFSSLIELGFRLGVAADLWQTMKNLDAHQMGRSTVFSGLFTYFLLTHVSALFIGKFIYDSYGNISRRATAYILLQTVFQIVSLS